MDLEIRIQILRDAEQISEETQSKILKVIDLFHRELDIKLTEENGAMLITHLCVAIERIKKGEIVNTIDSMLYEEIRNSMYFDRGLQVISKMEEEFHMDIPENEQQFIMMHLCVLFESSAN